MPQGSVIVLVRVVPPDRKSQTLLSAIRKKQPREAKQSSEVVGQEGPRAAGRGGSAAKTFSKLAEMSG